jgi:ubiquinone/menaquinone biosynthesis C-methylase UbiE
MADNDTSLDHYVIRGGEAGKERLDLLASIMEPSTQALLTQLDVGPGASLLDLGCGGGHVSLRAARLVAPDGSVTGVDLDEIKLDLARKDADESHLTNVKFLHGDAADLTEAGSFDYAYARFLLTHLSDPVAVLRVMLNSLQPGGIAAVEDIDVSGAFCYPDNPHFRRCIELYSSVVRRKGGDPDIGHKLPSLLSQAGFEEIEVGLVQPLHLRGEHKRLVLATLENIADPVVSEGLATPDELSHTIQGLAEFTADPTSLIAMPRIIQSWGVRPS